MEVPKRFLEFQLKWSILFSDQIAHVFFSYIILSFFFLFRISSVGMWVMALFSPLSSSDHLVVVLLVREEGWMVFAAVVYRLVLLFSLGVLAWTTGCWGLISGLLCLFWSQIKGWFQGRLWLVSVQCWRGRQLGFGSVVEGMAAEFYSTLVPTWLFICWTFYFFYNLLLLYFVRYAEAIVSFFSSRYPRTACKKYSTLTTLFYKKVREEKIRVFCRHIMHPIL